MNTEGKGDKDDYGDKYNEVDDKDWSKVNSLILTNFQFLGFWISWWFERDFDKFVNTLVIEKFENYFYYYQWRNRKNSLKIIILLLLINNWLYE